ncbi:MAG: DUF6913 domain-containing protein [Bacteroidia bacterium]
MRNIKRRVAEKYLTTLAKANKHPRKIISFSQINTIGILYDATLEETINEVKYITKKLMAMGKEIYTLGYINKKVLPPNLEPHTKEDYYCRKDLHWYQLPIKERISRFANEQFDYLLNVYTADQLPLVGVSALSKAHCRLGTFHRKYTGCYDFMINEKGTKTASELLDAYILYLYKLKNDQ